MECHFGRLKLTIKKKLYLLLITAPANAASCVQTEAVLSGLLVTSAKHLLSGHRETPRDSARQRETALTGKPICADVRVSLDGQLCGAVVWSVIVHGRVKTNTGGGRGGKPTALVGFRPIHWAQT